MSYTQLNSISKTARTGHTLLSFVKALFRGAPGYLLSVEQVVPIRGASRIVTKQPEVLVPEE